MAKVADAQYYMTRNTKAALDSNNAVYNSGHRILETDTESTKTGNGTDTYTALPYDYGYQKYSKGGLSTSGWYTIASTGTTSYEQASAEFDVICNGSVRASNLKFRVSWADGADSRSHENTTIEMLSKSSYDDTIIAIKGARIGYDDTDDNSGIIVQVNLDISTTVGIVTIMTDSNTYTGSQGLRLSEPVNNNTLPDSSTASSFLEAGEEFSFIDGTARFLQNVKARRADNNTLVLQVNWNKVPKLGSGISVTLPATLLRFYDGSGSFTTSAGGSYGSLVLDGKIVQFTWTETNIGLGLNSGGLDMFVQGTGGTITIT